MTQNLVYKYFRNDNESFKLVAKLQKCSCIMQIKLLINIVT